MALVALAAAKAAEIQIAPINIQTDQCWRCLKRAGGVGIPGSSAGSDSRSRAEACSISATAFASSLSSRAAMLLAETPAEFCGCWIAANLETASHAPSNPTWQRKLVRSCRCLAWADRTRTGIEVRRLSIRNVNATAARMSAPTGGTAMLQCSMAAFIGDFRGGETSSRPRNASTDQ
jgi:hypothetical protein